MSKQYVFKKVIDRSGVSAKTGNSYAFHQIEVVDKNTLDTLLFDYDNKKLVNIDSRFTRGELVSLDIEHIPNGYANRTAIPVIVGISPIK